MKPGDFITDVDGADTKWSTHKEVVILIKAAGAELRLKLITPLDRNFLEGPGSALSTPKLPTKMQGPTTLERVKKKPSSSPRNSGKGVKLSPWSLKRRPGSAGRNKERQQQHCILNDSDSEILHER